MSTDLRGAVCASLTVPESEALFFGNDWQARQEGIELCRHCPVMSACLDVAMTLETSAHRSNMAGTWGGLTVEQRLQVRRERR